MSTPKACIIQAATVSVDLNAESDSDVAIACRQDVSYPGDAFARTKYVLPSQPAQRISTPTRQRIIIVGTYYYWKKSSLTTIQGSALETMDAENGSDVVRRHDVEATCLGDKSEHVEVISAAVVDSADMSPHAEDRYALPEVLLLRGTETDIGVTSSATTVFDPAGIGYSLEGAVDEETASQKAGRVNNPVETLGLHYLAIAATDGKQGGDDDDSKTDIFERSGTDLDLTDYAHELAFLPDLTEVEPTELNYGAPNVKSSSHTPSQSASCKSTKE
ncbi:hypothetical protein PInf_008266 [Phytophthora infestans]|nr:hypothetical protein PInf_008266 [Phytophthora infestans]